MSNGRHLGSGSAQPDIPDDGKLRLYSMRFCPFAQRAHLVLEAKKIPYHTININLTNKPEWLKEKNPLLKVPALEIPNGGIIVESLIVADYLNEKYPERPLYPSDPLKKAIERMWIERFAAVTSAMYRVFSSWNSPGGAPGALTEICEGLDLYEAELKTRGTPFFFGDQPGMLDYMIWPWCERSDMLKYLVGDKYALDNARYPKLIKWRELMQEDSAVKKSYLTGDVHAKFLKTRYTDEPSYDMLVENPPKRPRLVNSD